MTTTNQPKAAQHTPGPWHLGMKPGPIVYGPVGEQVANLCVPLLDAEEHVANARLIAAAPMLLEAARDFSIEQCERCDGTGKQDGHDEHEACHRCGGYGEVIRGGDPNSLRAAIAAATGEGDTK